MQFNAIACQCDDYWTLNILFSFSFLCDMFRSPYFLDFILFYFIFLLQWMCVSTRTHNDDCCSSISIIFYVACFFFSSHLKVDFFLLSHSLFFKIFFWSHNSRKKHLHIFNGCTNTQTQISNEFLHFFIFTFGSWRILHSLIVVCVKRYFF